MVLSQELLTLIRSCRPKPSFLRRYSVQPDSHLNPSPSSFSFTPFSDRCTISISSGAGGNGCVSFLRDKYVPDGPPNGGDGGTGGSVYIQAVYEETSLHKIARRSIVKAGRGGNGEGRSRGGRRGNDVLITVPVGTVVRELDRVDPSAEERRLRREQKGSEELEQLEQSKFLVYPGPLSRRDHMNAQERPRIPNIQYTRTSLQTPPSPIYLDLSTVSPQPILLAAGSYGGLGNPHFVSRDTWRPKYATKGGEATTIELDLELKVLADVGLVGLPNAGKSTLLRALTNSRTRVGDWAFTTLQPSIGTVVLDSQTGRPEIQSYVRRNGSLAPRTSITIADIPGLIEDAHLDKGLGISFLRHVERAKCLCFVVDLSRDPIGTLKALWREVAEYERFRARELAETEGLLTPLGDGHAIITNKPWFIVATKADLASTKEGFEQLRNYATQVATGVEAHPSETPNAWKDSINIVPVSAINGEGVQVIPKLIVICWMVDDMEGTAIGCS